MYTRHNEVPVLASWPDQIAALYYNVVRRALMRGPAAIRLALPGLKTLDLIVQADAWIIVDRAFNDVPVAAWTDFQAPDDRALHEPVACTLRYYHAHASMITAQVLEQMDALLLDQLNDGDETHQVFSFPELKP